MKKISIFFIRPILVYATNFLYIFFVLVGLFFSFILTQAQNVDSLSLGPKSNSDSVHFLSKNLDQLIVKGDAVVFVKVSQVKIIKIVSIENEKSIELENSKGKGEEMLAKQEPVEVQAETQRETVNAEKRVSIKNYPPSDFLKGQLKGGSHAIVSSNYSEKKYTVIASKPATPEFPIVSLMESYFYYVENETLSLHLSILHDSPFRGPPSMV